jgi:hypothetical protein
VMHVNILLFVLVQVNFQLRNIFIHFGSNENVIGRLDDDIFLLFFFLPSETQSVSTMNSLTVCKIPHLSE